jgi:uncharacterized membrane protein HdeD (DUF308 family)
MNTQAPTLDKGPAWSVLFGVLLLLAGLLAIAAPFFAAIAASIFFGWLLVLGAVAHLTYAWVERGAGAILWQVLIGLVYLIAATSLLLWPVSGVLTLTLILAVYIAMEGVFELALYFGLRARPGSSWLLIDGIISLLLAGLIFFHWPSSSLWALGLLVGISLIFSGMARLILPARRRLA